MNKIFERPLGLALSGGGGLGSWQAGALEALVQSGLTFDAVFGFSAGALNGCAYSQGMLGTACQRWQSVDQSVLHFSPRLFPVSLFSDDSVRQEVIIAPDDAQARERASCRLTIMSSYYDRSRHFYARFSPGLDGPWDGPLIDQVVASCAVPILIPPQKLKFKNRDMVLVDGGVPCMEPANFQDLSFCRDVIVLEMVRQDEIGRKRRGFFASFDQKGREVLRALMDVGSRSLINSVLKPRVFRLNPSQLLDFSMFHFEGPLLREAAALGSRDAKALLSDSNSYRYENESEEAIIKK